MNKKPKELNFKTRLNIHYCLMAVGSVITLLGCYFSQNYQLHPVAWLGIMVMAGGLLWRIAFIKCPHCGDGLYQAHANLKYCPNCGKKLE